MGTTVAGLLLTANRAVWFNVGDSRVYGQRAKRFELLSIDDVPPGPRSGVITQTLGGFCTFVPIEPHMGTEELVLPSRWLVCSDGLTDMVDDRDIERALAASDEEAVCTLFDLAMRAGGADNVSIIVVRASTSS
jgi:serine/threonine protein phosphatase PrpC